MYENVEDSDLRLLAEYYKMNSTVEKDGSFKGIKERKAKQKRNGK